MPLMRHQVRSAARRGSSDAQAGWLGRWSRALLLALLAAAPGYAQAQGMGRPRPSISAPAAQMSVAATAAAGPTCPITFEYYENCGSSAFCQNNCAAGTLLNVDTGIMYVKAPNGCGAEPCPPGQCDAWHPYHQYRQYAAQCSGTKTPDPRYGACLCYDDFDWLDYFTSARTNIADGCNASTPLEVCSNGLDDNCNGIIDDGCPEICGDAQDNNGNGAADETCTMPNKPAPQACFEPDPGFDPLAQVNRGCQNGDWAGYDPILLAAKSAATEPFTDFQATALRTLALTRSYTSGAVMAGGAEGVFGLGWHHQWETTLACSGNGASCTVTTGLGERMAFAAQGAAVVGTGALLGESLVLYRRIEPENLAAGGYNLLVRRPGPGKEFILFQLDGSELHFMEPASCAGAACMDPAFNGSLRLTRDLDAAGQGVQLDFTAAGKLLTLTDDLGNQLSLLASGTCPVRAGTLRYRAGQGGAEADYVTYEYDGTCSTLTRAKPASGYTPAPGKTAQLRRYEYQSTPRPGLLTKVRNEFDDAIAVFGYDPTSGNATSLQEARSSLSISYPQGNKDVVTSSYGVLSSTATTFRDNSGKASTVNNVPGFDTGTEELWASSQDKMTWSGRYLTCSEHLGQYVRYFQRDTHNRATTVSDYGAAPYANSGSVYCKDSPWLSKVPLRSTSFEYGVTKPIAQGVSLSLELVTKISKTGVFGTQLATAAGGGAVASNYRTAETLDYDTVGKPGDPSAYNCGPSTLPVEAVVCRKFVEGYTKDATGAIVQQKLGTFYTYDARGRVVQTLGPIYVVGTPPTGNVNPVEERTYWPDDGADLLRRGRLNEVKRWPSGYPAAASALVKTNLLYDAFGPTQVQDEAGGIAVYSRAGGAGRVSRIDTPDGQHVSTRYYDGEKPRLILMSSGAARRFTYDAKGRLNVTEPLSGDPESGATVTVGWSETRDHDGAGNVTLITRKDAAGVVRWKQAFEHYPNGELRKLPHPESGKGYARWTRNPVGVEELYWDEDHHVTHSQTDALKRAKQVTFEYSDAARLGRNALPGGFVYEYEPEQDALRKVSSLTSTTGTPGGTYPVIAAYVHDDFGHLLSVSSPYTMTTGPYVYAYDARGNVVKRTGGGAVLTWQYDGVNRVTSQTATRNADSFMFTYSYTYDEPTARGRLRTITEPDRTTTFTFDEMGRARFEEVTESGVTTRLTTEYVYDADGDLSDVISPAGLHVKYERDPVTKDVTEVRNVTTGTKYASNVKHLPLGPVTNLTFAGGATLSQGFNLRYEPIAIVSGQLPSTTTALQLSYTVSGSGLMSAVGSMSFTYDKRDRLLSAGPSRTTPFTYVYPNDTATSWLAVNDRPQEARDAGGKRAYAFGYDDGSNMSAISKYDATGTNVASTTCLVHDALGRLTAVGPAKVLAGPDARACKSESDLANVTVRFRYDARNRRVGRQDGTGPWKQYVFTTAGVPLAELTRPTTSGGAWSPQRAYVWLDGRPLAQIEYPGPAGGNEGHVYLVHVDHLGQPRALTTKTNTTVWAASPPRPYGDIDEAMTADPVSGNVVFTNLRLPGQYDERLLGSINLKGPFYNHHRWYLPSLARYMELDPVALKGGLNGRFAPDWYGYANANPVRWTDPSGQEAIGAVIGAVFGGISGGLSARTNGKNVLVGFMVGAGIGFGIGLLDPTLGIGTMAIIGGVSAGAGNVVSTVWKNGPGDWGSWSDVSLLGVAGNTAAGAMGGALGGTFNLYVGTGAGATALSGFVGGLAGYLGDVSSEALDNALSRSDPNRMPWEDGANGAAWRAAAGCK